MVGTIVPCPKEIANTGHIFIVADSTHCRASQHQPLSYQWDYKAVEYDPIKQLRIGLAFNVSKEEMEKWNNLPHHSQ